MDAQLVEARVGPSRRVNMLFRSMSEWTDEIVVVLLFSRPVIDDGEEEKKDSSIISLMIDFS